ncbi:phage shock protein C [Bifidobacterium lemurum]|uniref:Phage shock protein C n=2 Tax=Bifidobacterium lemurum TaxID=1603886 RepID=A0A261FVF9_9BIFI|nr:phage shock protein C [Bifidobacterium lemurum]
MYGGPQAGPYHSSEANGQGGSSGQSQYAQGGQAGASGPTGQTWQAGQYGPAGQYGQTGQSSQSGPYGQSGQTGQSSHTGQAGHAGQYAQYGPNQSGQHRPRVDERFFVWARSSAITRGDDRWIGGVCSGLARRLGWSPTLVRALVLASVLLFGFGAALYAIGWMLMPDDRDGRILAEELIAGRWDWSCAGAFACLALAICIPGAGWLAIALAVLWILAQGGIRQQEGYGFAHHGPAPQAGAPGASAPSAAGASGMGAPSGVAGTASQFTAPAAQGTAYADSGSPSTMGYGPAEPATRPMSAQSNHYEPPVQSDSSTQPAPTASFGYATQPGMPAQSGMPAQPQGGAAYRNQPQTDPRPAAAAYAPAQAATYAVPLSVAPHPVKPRIARRKPAGPVVVLTLFGLILISAALLMGGFVAPFGVDGLEQLVRYGTIWIGAVCALLGVVIVALGLIGRRTGGLHPFVWIAAFLAFCMVCLSAAYSYVYDDLRLLWARDGYEIVNLGSDVRTLDSSERQLSALRNGVVFRGEDYDSSVVNIDLTDWEERYGTHDLTQDVDGERRTVESGCPTGQLNISAQKAQVQVTIPDGCTWTWGESDDYYHLGTSALGGKYTAVTDIGTGASIGFSSTGYWIDGYDSEYQWLRSDGGYVANEIDLHVNVENATEAQVRVVYESDSTLAGAAAASSNTKES